MSKSAPSAPPPPDPYRTAQAQTGSNVGTAIANTYLGNINETSPYGSVSYRQTGSYRLPYDASSGAPGGPGGPGSPGIQANTGPGSMAPGGAGSSGFVGGGAPGQSGMSGYYDIPQFERTVSLSPEQQQLYDQQTQLGSELNQFALDQTGRLQDTLGNPLSRDNLPARGQLPQNTPDLQGVGGGPQLSRSATTFGQSGPIQTSMGPDDYSADRTKVENALFSRLNPQLDRDRSALENSLVNQGLVRGTEAFNQAMDESNRQATDARMQAILAGGQEQSRMAGLDLQRGQFANQAQQQAYEQAQGRGLFGLQSTAQNNDVSQQEFQNTLTGAGFNNDIAQRDYENRVNRAGLQDTSRERALQEELAFRNQPINEISALMSGGQVTAPQFSQYRPGNVAGTDVMGAVYNSNAIQQQQYAQQMQQRNAMMGGLFGLGQAGVLGASRYLFPGLG